MRSSLKCFAIDIELRIYFSGMDVLGILQSALYSVVGYLEKTVQYYHSELLCYFLLLVIVHLLSVHDDNI